MLYQPGPQRIPPNVAQDGEQMVVSFNRESLKTPLPNMSAAPVVLMIATDVGRQKPLHPLAEISLRVRPHYQMKMSGHNTVAEYPHRNALTRSVKQVDKGFVISVFPKNLAAGITPINSVITDSACRSARRSWHAPLLPQQEAFSKKK